MSAAFAESVVEDAALAWLEALGYAVRYGPEIAAGESGAERTDPNCRDVVLEGRLREALTRLNPALPLDALEDAFRKLTLLSAPSPLERNRAVHRMLVDGVPVEYRRADGTIAGDQARVIDFDDPASNDWLAVNAGEKPAGENATCGRPLQRRCDHLRRPSRGFSVRRRAPHLRCRPPTSRAPPSRGWRPTCARGEATGLFGRERGDGLAAPPGNLEQSAGSLAAAAAQGAWRVWQNLEVY